MTRAIAVFDFDGTLVTGDSLPSFVACCTGWPRTLLTAFAAALVTCRAADRRTAFKALWLRWSFRNFPLAKIPPALGRLRGKLRWIEQTRARLHWHKARGDVIVVASGGLDLYLPFILADAPPDHLLCTGMEAVNGRLTGAMRHGNCVREEKARRVAELLAKLQPHGEVWAYGNAPHDLPMLNLADHKTLI